MARFDDFDDLERQRQQFLYAISHDLQEPFRKVRTFGARLAAKLGTGIGDSARDDLERMLAAAERGQGMIEGLLALSRIETRGALPDAVDLNETIAAVVEQLGEVASGCAAQIEVGPLPVVRGDRDQLRRLFLALVDNALKFRKSEISPIIQITSALGDEGASCRIIVSDNGIGFEPEHAERIFTVFQRLHPRDVYPGLGLGLAIAQRIAQCHGGHISAEGRPDRGAVFTLILPTAGGCRTHSADDSAGAG